VKAASNVAESLKRLEKLLQEVRKIAEQYHRLAVRTVLEVEKDERDWRT